MGFNWANENRLLGAFSVRCPGRRRTDGCRQAPGVPAPRRARGAALPAQRHGAAGRGSSEAGRQAGRQGCWLAVRWRLLPSKRGSGAGSPGSGAVSPGRSSVRCRRAGAAGIPAWKRRQGRLGTGRSAAGTLRPLAGVLHAALPKVEAESPLRFCRAAVTALKPHAGHREALRPGQTQGSLWLTTCNV